MSYRDELAAVKSLYKIHQSNKDIYITNGLLRSVEKNQELIQELTPEQQEFLTKSIAVYDEYHNLQYEANQENVKALAEAEGLAQELTEQKAELEIAKIKAEKNTDQARQELREQANDALEANRQKQQFSIFKTWWAPAIFVMSMSMMIGLIWLESIGKSNDSLLIIFGTSMGTFFGAFAVANSTAYNNQSTREESKIKSNKQADGTL